MHISKIILQGILTVTTMSIFSPTLPAAVKGPQSQEPKCINVKNYGAVGNGKVDDTKAVQTAFDAARARSKKYPHAISPYKSTIYFPPGKYLISATIQADTPKITGDNASIIQQNPDKDIIYYSHAWFNVINGMTFQGGRVQLSLGNKNVDKSQFTISECRFFRANKAGLEVRKGTNSSLLVIQSCQFIESMQAIISHSDWSSIRDCWITASRKMKNLAVIENRHGSMTIDNLMAVPLCNGDNQRWIDNYTGSVSCSNSRFGGEGGGFTTIYNYAKYSPFGNATKITIRECEISAQTNASARCVVYCHEVPNYISITDCSLIGIPEVLVAPHIDLKKYFYSKKKMLKYQVSNIGASADSLPSGLAQPVINKIKIPNQLTPQQTEKRLATIEKAERSMRETKLPPLPVDVMSLKNVVWTLDEFMDATTLKNSEFIALRKLDHAIILMRRSGGDIKANNKTEFSWILGVDWPHLKIDSIPLDLELNPLLIIDIQSDQNHSAAEVGIKLIDLETQQVYPLFERQKKIDRFEFDLSKITKLKDTKHIALKIYYIAREYIPATKDKPFYFKFASAGDYIVINQIGFKNKE